MDKSKILISENRELFNSMAYELSKFAKALNEVIEKYSALELGVVTPEVAELLLSPAHSKTIENQYWDALKKQLDKSGVVNRILRDTALNGSREPIEEFKAAYRKAHSLPNNFPNNRKYIVFDGCNFELRPGYAEVLLEQYCREYLTDKAEIAWLETVKNLVKAIAQYRAEAKKVEAGHYLWRSLQPLEATLKVNEKDEWVVDVETAINYYRFAKRNMNASPSTKRVL